MNCNEYVTLLTSASADEMQKSRAAEHSAQCADCNRITQVVMERERHLASVYSQITSSVPAPYIADAAMLASRRKTVSRLFGVASSVIVVMIVMQIVFGFIFPNIRRNVWSSLPSTVSAASTFSLHCLTPEQAGIIIQPYLRSNGSTYYASPAAPEIISVRGNERELAKVRSLLGQFDNYSGGVCKIQPPVVKKQ